MKTRILSLVWAIIYSTSHLKQSLSQKYLRNYWDFKMIFLSHVFLTYSSAPFLTKYLISQCRVVIWTLILSDSLMTDLNALTPFPRKRVCLNAWKMQEEYKTDITLRRQVNEFDLQRTNSSRTPFLLPIFAPWRPFHPSLFTNSLLFRPKWNWFA